MEEKILDVDEALARFSGNKKIYIKFLNRFLEINSKIKENTESVMNSENIDDIFIFFHSLKGGFGNLSAKQLYVKSVILENYAKNKDLNSLKSELPSFYTLFDDLEIFVREYEKENSG